jgi:hypothetical protein
MPRNQYANMIKQANNPDNRMEDISGSISNGSGSVINSLINTNQSSIYKTNNNITKIVKQVNNHFYLHYHSEHIFKLT